MNDKKERIVNLNENGGDQALDLTLRPKILDEYVGQKKTKEIEIAK